MFIKRELIGTTTKCNLCKKDFIIEVTTKYCKDCSPSYNLKNYLQNPLTRSKRTTSNLNYRKCNREKYRRTSNIQKIKDNDITKDNAKFSWLRWTNEEILYLKNNALNKTVIDIAFDLHRTYSAVMVKACILGIKTMTKEKK